MNQQLPSIGRIVHYTNLGDKDGKYPPEIQAALITGVYREAGPTKSDPQPGANENLVIAGVILPANTVGSKADSMLVDLTVFYRTGYFQIKAVKWSEEPMRGCWNWPPMG